MMMSQQILVHVKFLFHVIINKKTKKTLWKRTRRGTNHDFSIFLCCCHVEDTEFSL